MNLDQLHQWIGDVTYRLRPFDFRLHRRRWFWQRSTTALQALDSLSPDQRLAFQHALLQRLRQHREQA